MPPKPNFFIVGAPKAGTTALWFYLRQHPNIFMPATKEPHYFAGDLNDANRGTPYRDSEEGYLALFKGCRSHHLAVGEASVWYLYAPGAIRRILEFDRRAKIIALLRNPVEMAFSLHSQQLFNLQEDVDDFREAWHLQATRRNGQRIPDTNSEPRFLQYLETCRLGEQVERLIQIVPRDQMQLFLFDDFVASTREAYERTLTFLGVPSDGRVFFPRVNESKQIRSRSLAQWNHNLPSFDSVKRLKRKLGLPYYSLLRIPRWLYVRRQPRKPLDPDLRLDLIKAFREDVLKLQDLVGSDLSHWLKPGFDGARGQPAE